VADHSRGVWIRVPLELSIPRLLNEAGYPVDSSRSAQRRIQLFDTGDRRLAAAGAELSFNERDGWCWRRGTLGHPKLPPREWNAPSAAPQAQVMEWSRAYRRGRPLAARASVTVHRRSHHVTDGQSHRLLTFAEERVDEVVDDRWRPRIRRISVVAGGEDASAQSALGLVRDAALSDEPTLALLRPALVRAPRLRLPYPESTGTRELFVRSATLSVIQWLYFDCELSGGAAPEALRKLRVALRRLRSDLQAFAAVLDREWAGRLRNRFGELARHLGVVRDAEVLTARLSALISTLPETDQRAALPLIDVAAAQLEARRAELLDILATNDYLTALDDAVAAVTRPRWAGSADDAPPVTRLVRRPWRRLRDHVAAVGDTADDHELHRMRILAKRARYATEASVPAMGDAAARCAQRLAELQTILGDHHDAVVAREWLQQQAAAAAGLSFAAGELAALELIDLTASSDRWRQAWAAASHRQDWRWLRS
jgi:CHAD domain-containing protein